MQSKDGSYLMHLTLLYDKNPQLYLLLCHKTQRFLPRRTLPNIHFRPSIFYYLSYHIFRRSNPLLSLFFLSYL